VIDLHHHCLPGIDDGPREMAEAVDLCRMALADGIETIVATPHVLRGRWANTSRPVLEELLVELREQLGPAPRLLLGSEYYFSHDVVEVLNEGEAVVPLAGSRYVLVEFAAHAIPPMIEQPFYRMQLEGWTPIIAHPERNSVFQSRPELLVRLVELGAKTQITAASVIGDFGTAAEKAALDFLRDGLVHIMASDAHNTTKRPPRMTAAVARVRELAGEQVADALTRGNPMAVIEGRPLVYEPDPRETPARKGGFLTKLRRLFP
jgi:protein-tyrosine phosphatase